MSLASLLQLFVSVYAGKKSSYYQGKMILGVACECGGGVYKVVGVGILTLLRRAQRSNATPAEAGGREDWSLM